MPPATARKEFAKKQISDELGRILKERRSYLANLSEGGDSRPSHGGCIGRPDGSGHRSHRRGRRLPRAVSLVSAEEGARIEQGAVQLCRLTADILASQFE